MGLSPLLSDRVQSAAKGSGSVTFLSGDAPDRVPWARVHDDARSMAADLHARGIGPGDHVALLGATSRPLVTAIQACWLAGVAAVVLPIPMRMGSIEEFIAQTRARVRGADTRLLLIDADLAAFLQVEPGDPPTVRLDELGAGRAPDAFDPPTIDPTSLAILQFTSGSTSDPKGVMLPHAQVASNLDAIATAAHLDVDTDVLVSWLPLYHDMGLIGLLSLSMTTGTDLVLAGPQDFMAAPARWMEWMSEFGGTATAGPNFSYALAARGLRRASGLDLSRWRIGLNGAEPVDPDAVETFCAAGAAHRLDPRSVFCAFGMAEATLAVTFPVPMTGMSVDTVDLAVLEREHFAAPVDVDRAAPNGARGDDARRLARLGRPVPGLEIRIVDPVAGTTRGEREVGELEIRGDSVTTGYYERPDATAAVFHDGWLRTGDLGYLVEGELVVCGRIKDVIIVGGRNLFPEDVERAASEVEGVRAGNVIAFGIEGRRGREAVVVVAETRAEDTGSLREAVSERVRLAVGLPPTEIVFVAPGSLPKTSSGKLQRSLCRARYLDKELQPA